MARRSVGSGLRSTRPVTFEAVDRLGDRSCGETELIGQGRQTGRALLVEHAQEFRPGQGQPGGGHLLVDHAPYPVRQHRTASLLERIHATTA
nr:hypothetical protein [Actinacidiphila soli]